MIRWSGLGGGLVEVVVVDGGAMKRGGWLMAVVVAREMVM